MKSFFIFLAALALILPAQAAHPVNGIAAKVNGEIITLNELMIKVAPMQSVLMSQNPRRGPNYERQLEQLMNQMLDELIDRTVIYSLHKQNLQNLPDHAVEEEIEKIIRNVYAGDRSRFKAYLKATNLTRAQFKEQQRKELLVSIIRSQHFGEVLPPTEKEMNIEYASWAEANRDRQKDVGTYKRIYILKTEGDSEKKRLALAEDLVKQIAEGADFAELAKEHSGDSRASKGGLWEDTPRTDLQHEFGYAIFETTSNEIMGPLEDQYGYNIIQIVERKLGPSKPLSQVRDLIKTRVEGQKKRLNFEKWMSKTRDRSIVEVMKPFVDLHKKTKKASRSR
ncbi:peptidylprolyl isomerase [Akkermansiaceae bacterium]|nr:peptidylprolyl isomerase [Akkermansiaceae bacterium]